MLDSSPPFRPRIPHPHQVMPGALHRLGHASFARFRGSIAIFPHQRCSRMLTLRRKVLAAPTRTDPADASVTRPFDRRTTVAVTSFALIARTRHLHPTRFGRFEERAVSDRRLTCGVLQWMPVRAHLGTACARKLRARRSKPRWFAKTYFICSPLRCSNRMGHVRNGCIASVTDVAGRAQHSSSSPSGGGTSGSSM